MTVTLVCNLIWVLADCEAAHVHVMGVAYDVALCRLHRMCTNGHGGICRIGSGGCLQQLPVFIFQPTLSAGLVVPIDRPAIVGVLLQFTHLGSERPWDWKPMLTDEARLGVRMPCSDRELQSYP